MQDPLKGLLGISRQMEGLKALIGLVAPTEIPVLIRGERGTGKELVARAIHALSKRAQKALITLNCGGMTRELLYSELFGFMKGSFTGAVSDRTGIVLEADGGTLFLDEVGDLPFEAQSALLRFLQEGEVRPIGAHRALKVDVRIVSATNKDLSENFREDLYDRLNGITITLPPLRERSEDIPLLARHFVAQCCSKLAIPLKELRQPALEALSQYPWPGNVRELKHVIWRAVLLSGERRVITPEAVLEAQRAEGPRLLPSAVFKESRTKKKILEIISQKKEVGLAELQSYLQLSWRTVRDHVVMLEKEGLITGKGRRYKTYSPARDITT